MSTDKSRSKKSLSKPIIIGLIICGGIGLLSQPEDSNPDTQNFINAQQVENSTQEDTELDTAPEIENTTSSNESPEDLSTDTTTEPAEVYEPTPQVEPQAQSEPIYTTPTQAYTPAAETQPTYSSKLPLKALCKDGTISYQDDPSGENYRGMCSHHGGIAERYGRIP